MKKLILDKTFTIKKGKHRAGVYFKPLFLPHRYVYSFEWEVVDKLPTNYQDAQINKFGGISYGLPQFNWKTFKFQLTNASRKGWAVNSLKKFYDVIEDYIHQKYKTYPIATTNPITFNTLFYNTKFSLLGYILFPCHGEKKSAPETYTIRMKIYKEKRNGSN